MKSVAIALLYNALDLVTGVVVAVKNKNVQSAKLRDGLFKKVGFIICYFMAWVIDNYSIEIGFSIGVSILPIMVAYTVLTEMVSIIENVSKLNSNLLPDKLLEIFQLTGGNEKDDKNSTGSGNGYSHSG